MHRISLFLMMLIGVCHGWLWSKSSPTTCPQLDPQDGSKFYSACNMVQSNTGFQLPFELGNSCMRNGYFSRDRSYISKGMVAFHLVDEDPTQYQEYGSTPVPCVDCKYIYSDEAFINGEVGTKCLGLVELTSCKNHFFRV